MPHGRAMATRTFYEQKGRARRTPRFRREKEPVARALKARTRLTGGVRLVTACVCRTAMTLTRRADPARRRAANRSRNRRRRRLTRGQTNSGARGVDASRVTTARAQPRRGPPASSRRRRRRLVDRHAFRFVSLLSLFFANPPSPVSHSHAHTLSFFSLSLSRLSVCFSHV